MQQGCWGCWFYHLLLLLLVTWKTRHEWSSWHKKKILPEWPFSPSMRVSATNQGPEYAILVFLHWTGVLWWTLSEKFFLLWLWSYGNAGKEPHGWNFKEDKKWCDELCNKPSSSTSCWVPPLEWWSLEGNWGYHRMSWQFQLWYTAS